MTQISVIVRDFTGNAGRIVDGSLLSLNKEKFAQKAAAVTSILASDLVDHVVIVSNRDETSKFGEAIDSYGRTATWRGYEETYPELVATEQLRVVYVDKWGKNAGSGRAVQAGIDYALSETNIPYPMVWSPELAVTPSRLAKAMGCLERYNLDGIGFLREHFYKKPQWMMPQHTALVAHRSCWELASIPKYADGDEGITIDTEVGPATLAGMDDMARLLEAWKHSPALRIGMYGWNDPLPWNIDPDDPRQAEKIARQWAVVHEWARRSFPEEAPEATLNRFMLGLNMY